MTRSGWYADYNPELSKRWPWEPMLQTADGRVVHIDACFPSEQDCIDFIRDEVIGQTFLPGEDTPNMHLRGSVDEAFAARVLTDPRVPHDLLAAIGEPCPNCGHKIMDHADGFGGPGIHCHTQDSDGIMCECTSLGES